MDLCSLRPWIAMVSVGGTGLAWQIFRGMLLSGVLTEMIRNKRMKAYGRAAVTARE